MQRCHSCLAECRESFCRGCSKRLFMGRKVSHVLEFTKDEFILEKINTGGRLSISGVQIKHLLRLKKNRLQLTNTGGGYILKPAGGGLFLHTDAVAANEHVTTQIARRVFSINTAEGAYMEMSDGTPVYISKRFDRTPEGVPLPAEDFAQIAGKSEEEGGSDYKYDFSYEAAGYLIKKYAAAAELELEKFFRQILFSYLIGNGDAHLKNFMLLRNDEYGDYLLSPAYDLLCTRLHLPNESDMALQLFADGYESESYKAGTKYMREDFEELAARFGISTAKADLIISEYSNKISEITKLIDASFLNDELKEQYITYYREKSERVK